jgi:hypothetical protein
MKKILTCITILVMTISNIFAQCPTPIGSTTTNCNSCNNIYNTNQTTISIVKNEINCIPFGTNITVNNLSLVSGKLIVCGTLTILDRISTNNVNENEIVIQSTGVLNIGTSNKTVDYSLDNNEGITNLGVVNSYSITIINDNGYINNSGVFNIYGSLKVTSNTLAIVNKKEFYVNQHDISDGTFENTISHSTICVDNNTLFQANNYKNTVGEAIYYPSTVGIAKIKIVNELNLLGGKFIKTTNSDNINVCFSKAINYGSLNTRSSNINPISGCNIALPLTILEFYYEDNYINWIVTDVVNVDYFEIQKSFDGINFFNIGNKSILNLVNEYRYYDYNNSLTYYRLKTVDFDEKFEYSNIITNNINDNDNTPYTIIENILYDIEGEIYNVDDINNLPSGLYILKIITSESIEYKKLIIE